ncbi:MAG: hypothetical protein ABIP21_07990 [Acidimicrobiia bacterium]
MTGRRARAYLIPIGVVMLAILGPGEHALAFAPNPADRLFDRARHAVHIYEFSGSVRIWWRDGSGGHGTTVSVDARHGALDIDDGRIVHEQGRAWMRSERRWITLWGENGDIASPSLSPKYRVSSEPGPLILRRATDRLSVRRHGELVEIVDFDRETGVVLQRNRFDSSGTSESRMKFVALDGLRRREGPGRSPVRTAAADLGNRREAPSTAPQSLGQGFRLIEARSMADDATQLRYSDGVFEASVFSQPGVTDWNRLPSGGRDVWYGSVRTRRYRTPAGTVLVWQASDRTLTCVTDATGPDQAAMIATLSGERDGLWTSLTRFVNGPFDWE